MQPNIVQSWQVIEGALLPPITSMVLKSHWGNTHKRFVSFVFMLYAASVAAWAHGAFDSGHMLPSVLNIVASAIIAYHVVWKPTGIASGITAAVTGPSQKIVTGRNMSWKQILTGLLLGVVSTGFDKAKANNDIPAYALPYADTFEAFIENQIVSHLTNAGVLAPTPVAAVTAPAPAPEG